MRELCSGFVQFHLRESYRRDVHHRSNEATAGRFISPAMGYNVDMFDSAIRHPQSIRVSIILPVVRCALHDMPVAGDIFRVNALAHEELRGDLGRSIVLKNPEGFLRPVDFTAGRTPTKAASVTQSLCLREVGICIP